MADNVELDSMSGGQTAKTLDIAAAGFQYQQIIVGDIVRVEDNFSRPADTTAYAAGDMVANTTTAGSVTAANSAFVLANVLRDADLGGYIDQIVLRKDDPTTTDAAFRIHFFDTDPFATAPGSGDNAAINLSDNAADDYLGYIDVDMNLDLFGSGASDSCLGVGYPTRPIAVKAASGTTIWGVLEVRDAYVPKSGETFTLYAHVTQG